jgi:flagellar FliJ protein
MSLMRGLSLAIELAQSECERAQQLWMQARRAHEHAEHQLKQLENYANETQGRWSTAGVVGFHAELMRHHQQFQMRLNEAIHLQQQAVRSAQDRVELTRKERVQRELRLKALEKVRDNKLAEQALTEARRDQKNMDELATQQFLRNKRQSMTDFGERI